jgi:hypothetical protein
LPFSSLVRCFFVLLFFFFPEEVTTVVLPLTVVMTRLVFTIGKFFMCVVSKYFFRYACVGA